MEQARNILLIGLLVICFLLWTAWQKEHAQLATINATQTAPTAVTTAAALSQQQLPAIGVTAPQSEVNNVAVDRFIQVKTDVLKVTIDKLGGNLVNISLPGYPETLHSKTPFVLLNTNPATIYVAQSGLVSNSGPDSLQNQSLYSSSANSYVLAANQSTLLVRLEWKNPQGLKVAKIFQFQKGKYDALVSYEITNQTSQNWSGYHYAQIMRKDIPQGNMGMFQINPYMGGVLSSSDKRYEKISFKDMEKADLNRDIKDGWAAMLQHYFLSAWIPDNQQTYNYSSRVLPNNIFLIRMVSSLTNVAAGQQATITSRFYAGPAIADTLKSIAPGLDLTVDYGILWFISTGIFWLMKHIHDILGNWGWAIVLVTVFIKLIFYKLSATSYKSMAAMRKLQPKLTELKERYGDDRQKISQATMELYRKEKVNPLGGCLPVLVQIPVFIALYWVLLESVELRQAPFILWIKDLSIADPFYVLPVIMGISIFLQQKMNPAPMDPIQAKVMMVLPIFFTALFLNFPAGLVLYWVVNNILSITQQWFISRNFEMTSDSKKALPYKKPGK